jgi:hypothetical protein
MFTLQTSFNPLLLKEGEKTQLRPRIWPHEVERKGKGQVVPNYRCLTLGVCRSTVTGAQGMWCNCVCVRVYTL